MGNVKPGQRVQTPKGRGQVLHPERPGYPEKRWVVVIGKTGHIIKQEDMVVVDG